MSEIDLSFRVADPDEARPQGPARLAIAAALLLHAGIALWFVLESTRMPAAAPEAPIIIATLVREPPPAPPPAPPPKPPQNLAERESGPGEKTTAPPPAEEIAPTPEAPAPTAPEAETPALPAPPAEHAAEPAPPPAAEKPKRPAPPRQEPHKEQFALRAPALTPPHERTPGERDETGDPYLNVIWARIERNRAPTTPIGPSGLHLEGITVYELLIDHGGHLLQMALRQSSGAPLLDAEVERMIMAATPFPAPPADYPERTVMRVTIRLFPR